MEREQISTKSIDEAMKEFELHFWNVLHKKKLGTFSSTHEIQGVIQEELNEFTKEVQANEQYCAANELLDLAVAALFGYTCIKENTIDW